MSDTTRFLQTLVDCLSEDSETSWILEVFDQAKKGTLSEEEALQQVVDKLSDNPTQLQALARMVGEKGESPLSAPTEALEAYQNLVHQNEGALPRLDPLYEAALIERLQFDGDIPELRSGPLPAGATPAVPVRTAARSLIALGAMLNTASTQMAEKIHEAEALRISSLGTLGQGTELATTTLESMELAAWGGSETDLPEYRRGEVPLPQVVETPTGTQLSVLTPEEERDCAYRALATTQGRRSAVLPIEKLLVEHLQRRSIEVAPLVGKGRVVSTHEWTCNMDGGKSFQPRFSTVDVAAAALAAGLVRKLEVLEGPYHLEVLPVNAITDRVVGWSATLRKSA